MIPFCFDYRFLSESNVEKSRKLKVGERTENRVGSSKEKLLPLRRDFRVWEVENFFLPPGSERGMERRRRERKRKCPNLDRPKIEPPRSFSPDFLNLNAIESSFGSESERKQIAVNLPPLTSSFDPFLALGFTV